MSASVPERDRQGGDTPYRLVLFDFDGTLVDSLPWLVAVLDEVSDHFSLARVPRDELESLRDLDGRSVLRRLGVPLWKVPGIAAHVRKLAARDLASLRLFEGVPEMLRALDVGGVDLAIVSSNSAENVQRVLGVESASRIRWYECGASLFGKASRLRKVLARSGRRAAEAIYVGDEVRDAEAAASSGIAFGAVSWGYNSAGRLVQQAPVELFRDVPELVAKLGPRR